LQIIDDEQPPRESSTPASTHWGALEGEAQKVAPRRQGAMPWVQETLAAQGATQVPPLQTLPPVQPPAPSSAPLSLQVGWLVLVAQAVTPFRHGPRPWVQGRLAMHMAAQAEAAQTYGHVSFTIHCPLLHISMATPLGLQRVAPPLHSGIRVSGGATSGPASRASIPAGTSGWGPSVGASTPLSGERAGPSYGFTLEVPVSPGGTDRSGDSSPVSSESASFRGT
jgi:hypothetical protein